jgi:hypothetical protein
MGYSDEILGGWSKFKTIKIVQEGSSGDGIDVPQKVIDLLKDIAGVAYVPVAASVQIVNGKNYRLFCNTKVTYLHTLWGAAIVTVYDLKDKDPEVTSIIPIHL